MSVAVQDQAALDERVVEDADLEAALEARAAAKEKASFANKTAKEKDEQAKAALEELGIEEGAVVRVGRFRVEKRAVKPRSVSFETAASSQLRITADE